MRDYRNQLRRFEARHALYNKRLRILRRQQNAGTVDPELHAELRAEYAKLTRIFNRLNTAYKHANPPAKTNSPTPAPDP